MTDLVIFFGAMVGIVGGSEAIGSFLLRGLGFDASRRLMVIAWGVGMLVITEILLVLGLIGAYTPAVMFGIWGILLVLAILRIGYHVSHWLSQRSPREKESEWLFPIVRISLVVMLLVCFATVLTPETRYDPYDYHLSIPSLYLNYGQIVEIPWHVFSYMPKNGEILFGWALGVGNDSIAKMIHYWMGCLGLLAIATFMTRMAGKLAGLLAAALVVTMPLFGFLSTTAYVDLIRSCWELLALLCLALHQENAQAGGRDYKWLVLSALFAGMALGTKYVAGFVFLPAYLICLLLSIPWNTIGKARWLLPTLVAALCIPIMPWLILNEMWTKNPFYPLFPSLFGMHIPAAQDAYLFFRHHAPPAEVYTQSGLIAYVLARIYRFILDGNSMTLIGLAGLFSLSCRRNPGMRQPLSAAEHNGLAIFIMVSGFLFLIGTDNDDGRFCFTSLALLSIPAVYFLFFIDEKVRENSEWGAYVVPLVVLFLFYNGLSYRFTQLKDLRETIVPILTDTQRDEWLFHHFPNNYPAVEWANENLPKDAMVLGMGYPLRRKHISGVKHGTIPFLYSLPPDIPPNPLAHILRIHGITHIVKPYPNLPYPIDFSILENEYLKPVYRYRGTTIFALIDAE